MKKVIGLDLDRVDADFNVHLPGFTLNWDSENSNFSKHHWLSER